MDPHTLLSIDPLPYCAFLAKMLTPLRIIPPSVRKSTLLAIGPMGMMVVVHSLVAANFHRFEVEKPLQYAFEPKVCRGPISSKVYRINHKGSCY